MFAARVEDFKCAYPNWAQLELGQIVTDEYYFYRRTKKGNFVQMWPKVLGKEYYKSRFFERFKVPRDFGVRPGQSQLELEKEASAP